MEQIGKLITCDICGKTQFLEAREGHNITNGTVYKAFTYEKTDWMHQHEVGDLCPECSEQLKRAIKYLKEGGKFDDE